MSTAVLQYLAILLLGGVLGSLLTLGANRLRKQRIAGKERLHAKIKRLIEANLIGVYIADFDGRIYESNDAFLEMVGYGREDLYAGQMNWVEMTPSRYVFADRHALDEQEATGVCVPFEKEYYRKNGSIVPVLFGCAVFDKELQRSIGFVVDLSKQKEAEAALRRSEAKFRRFVESNLLGVAESNLDGVYIEANDAFLNMVGYTREELYNGRLNWREMTPPEYLQLDNQVAAELRVNGTCPPFEKEHYRKDGSRVPILLGHVVIDREAESTIGFILDLTDRKQAELASVLEERNRIARDIHDTLAQSFTSILVHLKVASRKLDAQDIPLVRDCLTTSYELAQTGLAEARRSVAALRPQYLEQKDLYAALCLLAESMFAHTDTKLVCTCEGDRYLLQSRVEEHLLRIGQEALMNASKYAEATEIQLIIRYQLTECVLQVKDNGKGFSWSDQNTHRGSDAGGFGLLGIQERAERMGAKLAIQTAPGQGTNIQVWVNREKITDALK